MFIVDCVLEGSILSGLMIVLRCGLAEGLSSWGRPDLATELAWPYVQLVMQQRKIWTFLQTLTQKTEWRHERAD
jgi:hypothetical protein